MRLFATFLTIERRLIHNTTFRACTTLARPRRLLQLSYRTFAKKGKRQAAEKKGAAEFSGGSEYDLLEMTQNQDEHLEYLKESFGSISVSNNDPISILSDLKVEIDGSMLPIKAIGSVSKRSGQILVISLYDESYSQPVVRAIQDLESSFSPSIQADKTQIFAANPKITSEFRKKLQRVAKEKVDKVKQGIQREQKAATAQLKSFEDSMGNQDVQNVKKEIENQTSKRMKKVEELYKAKDKELSK